jgi:hypothetical protein
MALRSRARAHEAHVRNRETEEEAAARQGVDLATALDVIIVRWVRPGEDIGA